MTLINGKKLAEELALQVKVEVEKMIDKPLLSVITCDPNFETKKYLSLKQNKAKSVGIEMSTIVLEKEVTTLEVCTAVENEVKKKRGIVVQLPFPSHIDTDVVLSKIPKNLDVDAFGYEGEETEVLPPVVGAIAEIAKYHDLDWKDKKVVIFGAGRLVGLPSALFARSQGAKVTIINKDSPNTLEETKLADIIILGVGQPNLLTPDMVKDKVVVFDAGASEDGGLLVGDADPQTAHKSALFTPVPGGIGPMTIVLLLRNLLKLQARQ